MAPADPGLMALVSFTLYSEVVAAKSYRMAYFDPAWIYLNLAKKWHLTPIYLFSKCSRHHV